MSWKKVLQLINRDDTLMAAAVVSDDHHIPYSEALSIIGDYRKGRKAQLMRLYHQELTPEVPESSTKAQSDARSSRKASAVTESTSSAEQEYLNELRFALEAPITPRERRFLEKIRTLLNISASRATQLEASLHRNRLFVSYSRNDKAKVLELLKLIERETGESCWVDLTGIESGSQFEETIMKAIDEADVVLFMMSDSAIASSWTKREVYYAESENKRIVPISVDGKGMRGWVKFHFGHIDCIDSSSSDQVAKLIGDLKSWLSAPPLAE